MDVGFHKKTFYPTYPFVDYINLILCGIMNEIALCFNEKIGKKDVEECGALAKTKNLLAAKERRDRKGKRTSDK